MHGNYFFIPAMDTIDNTNFKTTLLILINNQCQGKYKSRSTNDVEYIECKTNMWLNENTQKGLRTVNNKSEWHFKLNQLPNPIISHPSSQAFQ